MTADGEGKRGQAGGERARKDREIDIEKIISFFLVVFFTIEVELKEICGGEKEREEIPLFYYDQVDVTAWDSQEEREWNT